MTHECIKEVIWDFMDWTARTDENYLYQDKLDGDPRPYYANELEEIIQKYVNYRMRIKPLEQAEL